jgi:hypothetical protein
MSAFLRQRSIVLARRLSSHRKGPSRSYASQHGAADGHPAPVNETLGVSLPLSTLALARLRSTDSGLVMTACLLYFRRSHSSIPRPLLSLAAQQNRRGVPVHHIHQLLVRPGQTLGGAKYFTHGGHRAGCARQTPLCLRRTEWPC